MNYELDKTDRGILSILLNDAKVPYAEVAERVGVSAGTVHVRMKKLERIGLVKGSQLVVNAALLGYDLCAFVGVFLEKGSAYRQVLKSIEGIPEVVEAHYTTGGYGLFLKIQCRNTQQLRMVLNQQLQSIDGIQRTETFISLEEPIHRKVPLPAAVG